MQGSKVDTLMPMQGSKVDTLMTMQGSKVDIPMSCWIPSCSDRWQTPSCHDRPPHVMTDPLMSSCCLPIINSPTSCRYKLYVVRTAWSSSLVPATPSLALPYSLDYFGEISGSSSTGLSSAHKEHTPGMEFASFTYHPHYYTQHSLIGIGQSFPVNVPFPVKSEKEDKTTHTHVGSYVNCTHRNGNMHSHQATYTLQTGSQPARPFLILSLDFFNEQYDAQNLVVVKFYSITRLRFSYWLWLRLL